MSPSPITSSASGWRATVPSSSAPAILCAGIAVQDIVFRVKEFPPPGGKCMTQRIHDGAGRLRGQCRGCGGAARRARPLRRAAGRHRRQCQQSVDGRHGARGHRHVRCGACVSRDRAGIGHHGGRRGRADDRHAPRHANRDGADHRSGRAGEGRRPAARRQSLSRFRPAGLRGGKTARHPGRARRRPADGRGRSAVCDPDPRDLFLGVPARHHRARRSRGGTARAWRRAPRRSSR